jgi:hypothetical protein
MAAEDYQTGALDEHLWSFRGFHESNADPRYRARQWRKVPLGAIGPHEVTGLAVWEMAFMVNVAREIEEPILEYSHQNGEGFRVLLPSLARFLGKNHDEAAHAARHGLPWCESPWCAEERRHATVFARIVERLTGSSPGRDNPNRPQVVTSSEDDAVRLVISRQAAEWSSSSTYLVMAAHATGALHLLLRNVARDEIKHLSILAAADRYLFGPRPWRRAGDLIRHGLREYRAQRQRRSGGDLIGVNALTAFEVVAAHAIGEFAIRRWLATLPLATLEAIFEGRPDAPAFVPDDLTPAQRDAHDAALRAGHDRRVGLARWGRRRRARALEQRRFEQDHAREIEAAARELLAGREDAALPGSRAERALLTRIANAGGARLRSCLVDRLRDRQIRGNRHVLARWAADVGTTGPA